MWVYASGMGLTSVAVLMMGTTDFSVMMTLALFFGISYGIYIRHSSPLPPPSKGHEKKAGGRHTEYAATHSH